MSHEFEVVIGIRNEQLLKRFGERVRFLRSQKGISQEKLANLSGITISQVSRIERGEVNTTISTLEVLSKSLNIPLPELVDLS
ncbi:MAG: helix-turn-helix transcriptional regulator [Ekhidna sp.]|uniref:helix-turn-helix domain-containing protein n=1 Tax=Ekhidna sp. TaxID=2608089 RepID=UPI0032EE517C